jgi:glycogen operon protein
MSELATRLAGSSDLYEHNGRRPYASINFVTSHDGFTLRDLVSYNEKHNEANLEENRDGDNHNLSWNHGVEGPTEDSEINALRWRQMRNFMTTLLTSQGVPMLRSGDEIGHTQHGNNNAYCQDNEISWLSWELDEEQQAFLDFLRSLVRLRQENPVLHRRKFFQGRPLRGSEVKDILWLKPSGREMSDRDWQSDSVRCLGVFLEGEAMAEVDERGRPVSGDSLLILLNAHAETVTFRLPSIGREKQWQRLLDTMEPLVPQQAFRSGQRYELRGRSQAVFRLEAKGGGS